jgi:DNA-binding HxlR family transcriptional regulator
VTQATTPTPAPRAAAPAHAEAVDDRRACSIARSLDVMGDRWSILILRDTFRGIRRFEEIRRDLEIPRAVLSDRLSSLVEAGVLEKRMYMEHPPRHEYRLTDMGRELSPVLVGLMQWGDRWLGDGIAPTVLVHEACGTEVDLGFRCDTCEREFGPTEIRGRPGPGAVHCADAATETTGSQS